MLAPEEEIEPRVAGGGSLGEIWETWSKKFEDGQLNSSDFRSYWAVHVPQLLALSPQLSCLSPRFDEQAINYTLLQSLEKFITGSPDPSHAIKLLKQKESPPTFCGKVFKSGEPTYSCRDCSVDPTCVMCAACFKASEHGQHKYKMNISRGGGYCDCGDREAWKIAPTCEIHDKESVADEDVVPQDMQARLRLVAETILIYAYQLLTWSKDTELPTDLQVGKKKSLFVMMLFNDESHTYEQVITSLSRAIDFPEREAVEYVATVDREGRSMIKIDGFTECYQVKTAIERTTGRNGSNALKATVMTVPLVTHQMFAGRALQWIDNFCKQLRAFARIVGNVLITVPTTPIDVYPIVRCVMHHDTDLWKSARQLWHQLIINAVLMDPESKLTFAKLFARDYPDLMKAFIIDDHEHTMSVMSLSVQIFSVVSVAHTLIAEDNVLSALMRTFLSECENHKNPTTQKLAFDRNHTSTTFKRSQFVLGDLRYLLYVKPTEPWSQELRKGFFAGLDLVLQLLSEMQCMDSVVRQVGQHVEFEAEWETGINIQLKLSPVLSILLEWCESDKDCLIRSLRRTLDFLVRADKSCSETNYVERSLGGSYDKEVQCIDYDVSTQPMSVHLPLSRFLSGLLLSTQKFGLDYVSYHIEIANKPSLVQIMEQPLRLQVMVAQFRAGMWRRNGYSLLNQVFFYANFRLRAETYDRDISLLQYCAAKMDPNEFLIHVLNKFDLLAWFKTADAYRPPSDVSPDMSGPLAEDFLSLILYLVAERHLPGVGEVTETDRVKKEIIQLLCMEPLPHSVLVKQLPARYDDSAMEIILEEVLREIAVFKRVSNAIGKYELKPEYYQYFNPFFYHYSREEQSKAEEVQLKRRKAAGLPPFCPPAKLPNFSPAFKPILNILDCDVFQHVLNIILTRCRNGSSLHSDAQLERALHLVGIGLDEVQRGCLSPKFLERMSEMKESFEMASRKLEASASLMALANHIIMKMSVPASGDSGDATMTQAASEDSTSRNKRGRNAELAAARRAKIMAAMSAQQNHFLKEHGHMFEEAAEVAPEEEEDKPKFICILCREEEVVSLQAKKSLVVSAFVQKSAVLQKSARDNPGDSSPLARGLPPSDLRGGAHVSTCGHVMHSYCWQAFYELVQTKERRRPVRYGRHVSFDVAQGEFLCPLCECLSNTVIPLVPTQRDETFQVVPEKNLSEWLDGVRTIADSAVPIGTEDANEMCRGKLWKPADGIAPDHRQMLPLKAEMMLHRFVQTTSHVVLGNEDDPFLAIAWTLAYTIQATEWCIRSEDKALLADISSRKLYCLENMVKATQVVSLMGIVKGYNVASDCLQALRCILLPQTEVDSCILEIDPFGLLCLLHFSLHRISDYDTFSLSKNLLSLVTALHLVQIIISLYLQMDKQGETPEAEPSSQTPLIDVSRVNEFAGEVLLAAGLSANSRFPPASRVMDALVPFLRATAILQYFASPKECRGWMRNNQLNDAASLCSFIGLSVEHLESILRCRPLRELALSWARQPKVLHLATSHWKPIYPLKVNSLITLPTEYSELINYVSLLTCPSSDGEVNILGDEVRTPTMCLVCSAVLCSQSYCCQTTWGSQRVGACVAHAAKCSAGVGVFLRIKDCRVMLLVGDSKGSYLTPPYVDEYGETDIGLARGNPLSLCSSAYMQLNQLWLTHGVPEQVAHALEASANLSSANWSRM